MTTYTPPQDPNGRVPRSPEHERLPQAAGAALRKVTPAPNTAEQMQTGNGNGQAQAMNFHGKNEGATFPLPMPPSVPPTPQLPELEGGNVILHRSSNFFVRTAYRPDQKGNPLRRGRTSALPKVMPNQGNRIADSETRLLPTITPINPVKAKRFPVPAWAEATVIVFGLLVSLVAHAYNIFNFPRYELDEGTYMSSAWAIMHGLITPYPYGYGHPPLAWVQIAAWIQLTGGFFTFGNALNSGRVLMLFYALGCSLLIYLILRRLSGSRATGLLAMVIFSLSPLSITYQRQVLLDNIGIFWMLLSIFLLVVGNSRLLYIVLAAVCFGLAVLSKEIFILFFPCMVYATWMHTTKFQRKFALVAFIYSVIALSSGFVLMAILRGELFPYSWHLPWDTHPHLSMLDTFVGQAQRGSSQGSFLESLQIWDQYDIVLVILSVVATVFNLAIGWWKRKHLLLALMATSYWLLLVRGGIVIQFYLIPLIPLVAFNTAMALNTLFGWFGKLIHFEAVRALLLFGVIAFLIPYDLLQANIDFTQHPTSTQTDAMVWVRNHVPHNAVIVINSYLYMDLRQPDGQGVGDGATYPHADVYVNIAFDPELHDTLLQGNWDRIDYIVADSEMLTDIRNNGGQNCPKDKPNNAVPFCIIQQALDHSIERASFQADDHDKKIIITVYQVIHQLPPPSVSAPHSITLNRRNI